MPTMTKVNIHEAKTHLSKLVERAAQGEEIVIAKAGKGMARLVPLYSTQLENPRKGGWGKDLLKNVNVDAFFDPALDKEIASQFYDGALLHEE
jgi:prevent-host-death family protein